MKFNIAKDVFLQHLSFINPIVERKPNSPVLSHVLLQAPEKDFILLKGTDGEITLSSRMNCDVLENGEITVNCNRLFDIVRSLSDNALIECELKDDQFILRNEQSVFSLSTLPAMDFPTIQEIDVNRRMTVNAADFVEGIEYVKFSIAVQDIRPYLNGLHLDVRDGQVNMVSTDGHRLSLLQLPYTHLESDDQKDNFKVILPRKSVNEIQKLLSKAKDTVELEISHRHVRIVLENFEILTRLLDGEYPDYRAVIPPNNEQPVIVNRLRLLEAIMRGRTLSNDRHSGIRFDLKDHQLLLTTRNIDGEVAKDAIDVLNPENLDLHIGFNIMFLIEVLQAITAEDVQMHIRDQNSSCTITLQDMPQLTYIIMPMHL